MTRTSLAAILSLVVAATARAAIPVPDPGASACVFPEGTLPCPGPVAVNVTLRDASFSPISSCTTQVTIAVESGSLASGQVEQVEGVTGPSGEVTLTFENGILGQGTIHFEVFSIGCWICASETYLLDCSATSARATVSPARWGRIKALYR